MWCLRSCGFSRVFDILKALKRASLGESLRARMTNLAKEKALTVYPGLNTYWRLGWHSPDDIDATMGGG